MVEAVDHGQRAHATWSASSTARNWRCAGALALARLAPPDVESIHAATGTAVHQIAEKCLRSGKTIGGILDAGIFIGEVETTKTAKIEITEDLADSAQSYVGYVRQRLAEYREATGQDATLWIEERFSFAALDPPFDAGGTGDAVLYFPAWRLIEIVDLKNGMGLVEVEGNKQARSYALGALLKHPALDVRHVQATIVQPRAHHKDGRIRSETIHVAELIDWTAELLAVMGRSREAWDSFPGADDEAAYQAWCERWLVAGNCDFCRSAGFCPKLRAESAAEMAGLADRFFEPLDGEVLPAESLSSLVLVDTPRNPVGMTVAELNGLLGRLDMVEGWADAVRTYAKHLAEQGAVFDDWMVIETNSRRAWKAEDEAEAAALIRAATDLTDDQIFARKLKSPAQVEAVLRTKARKQLVADLNGSKKTGTRLVRKDKTDQPELQSLADRFFQTPTEN